MRVWLLGCSASASLPSHNVHLEPTTTQLLASVESNNSHLEPLRNYLPIQFLDHIYIIATMDLDKYEKQKKKKVQTYKQKRSQIFQLFSLHIIAFYYQNIRVPNNDLPYSGYECTQALLNGNHRRTVSVLRLSASTFRKLIEEFNTINLNPCSKLICIEEQLAIFLYIVGQSASNRQTQD